jgi:hypothetical protein
MTRGPRNQVGQPVVPGQQDAAEWELLAGGSPSKQLESDYIN